jgi:hypothetical protein
MNEGKTPGIGVFFFCRIYVNLGSREGSQVRSHVQGRREAGKTLAQADALMTKYVDLYTCGIPFISAMTHIRVLS